METEGKASTHYLIFSWLVLFTTCPYEQANSGSCRLIESNFDYVDVSPTLILPNIWAHLFHLPH